MNKMRFLSGTMLGTAMLASIVGLASPVLAQAAAPAAAADAPAGNDTKEIVVTGTLFRSSADNIASPVTVMTADDIAKRGITTIQGAIQSLASNNGPALTNSFTANGAFAGGASAVSLRGLSTNSTLVLFDGLRAAYYPLADDGARNFVDLNTIPDEIVERVDVLKDGASSTYGADAVAGVVNIITKKQITGISGMAEGGVAQRGYGGNQRVSLTAGFGDLNTQGFNVYVSGHYINQDAIFNRDVRAPFNNSDQTGICYQNTCGIDQRLNSPINFSGVSTIAPVLLVRPGNPTTHVVPAGTQFQFLNPAAGCGSLTPYNLTAAERAAFPTSPATVCTQDVVHDGGVVEPHSQRWGVSSRASVNIGNARAYLEFNFEQSSSSFPNFGLASTGVPTAGTIRANGPPGIFYPRFSTAGLPGGANSIGSAPLALPVFICPRGTVTCNATNGTLNPQNPFAAAGQEAQIIGSLPGIQQHTSQRSRVYRLATGINGTFGDSWDYNVNAVGMINDLRRRADGYVYIQHLLDVINDGTYNFVNPLANTQAQRDYLTPRSDAFSRSEMYQIDASLTHELFQLPGGPVQVAVGGSIRKEIVNSPSANSDANGPTQRYFIINAFGTVGSRWVESPYFEIKAPVLTSLNLDLSGRYDNYSSGQHSFSPKAGVVFQPFRQIALRGAISKGFRIPSFGESAAIPTVGFVPVSLSTLPAAFLAAHSIPGQVCTAATPANCSPYLVGAAFGLQSISNPNLKPEKSRNISIGTDIKPFRGLRFTVDYYNIRKTGAIIGSPTAGPLAAYYSGQAVPAGYTITPAPVDVLNPTALPLVGIIGSPYINAAKVTTDGVDFGAAATIRFANGWSIESDADVEYIHKLNTTLPGGVVQRYAGTLGNFNLTSGSGTPRWKGSWSNTLNFGEKASITATAYYTSGYNLSADDQGGGRCTDPITAPGLDGGNQACNTRRFINTDLTGQINVGKFTFYANILNLFDVKPPLDTVTYGGYLYNPVVAEAGVIGRAFRVGGRFKF